MQPVLLDVADVVEQVDRGADQAEGDERQRDAEHSWREKPAGGQRRRDDEEVLHPLAGSHRADRGRHPAPANGNLRGLGHQDATLSIPFSSSGDREQVDITLERVRINPRGASAGMSREQLHMATPDLEASVLRKQLHLPGSCWRPLRRFLVAC